MAKVKKAISVPFITEDGVKSHIHVKWYCGDEEGYGIEVDTDEVALKDWAFGSNCEESYKLSSRWFEYVENVVREHEDFPIELEEINLYIESGHITKEDQKVIESMKKMMNLEDKLYIVAIEEPYAGGAEIRVPTEDENKIEYIDVHKTTLLMGTYQGITKAEAVRSAASKLDLPEEILFVYAEVK